MCLRGCCRASVGWGWGCPVWDTASSNGLATAQSWAWQPVWWHLWRNAIKSKKMHGSPVQNRWTFSEGVVFHGEIPQWSTKVVQGIQSIARGCGLTWAAHKMQLRVAAAQNYLSYATDPYGVKFITNWFLTQTEVLFLSSCYPGKAVLGDLTVTTLWCQHSKERVDCLGSQVQLYKKLA